MNKPPFEVLVCIVVLAVGFIAFAVAPLVCSVADEPPKPEAPTVVMEPAEQPSKPADGPMSPEERQAACSAAVTSALKKYDCTLQVAMLVTQKGNEPIVQVVPNQQEIKK